MEVSITLHLKDGRTTTTTLQTRVGVTQEDVIGHAMLIAEQYVREGKKISIESVGIVDDKGRAL